MPHPPPDAPALTVVEPRRPRHCAECHQGPYARLFVESDTARCLDCADLGHLVYLPRGNTTLTRRAREHSTLSAVVVRFNRNRRRYERQGILVEEEALARAEEACLADAESRARRRTRDAQRRSKEDAAFTRALTAETSRLYPSCPPERAVEIASHASLRGSGRVGRSAAGRALHEETTTAAVRASIRHVDTPYDELLMAGTPRNAARAIVSPAIETVLTAWRAPTTPTPNSAPRP
ncbi:DUF2293 domain-containing protein [Streptomyces beijiangensis]|uniref:DUF2293 domain-containing protein n=1 Tax=Streptomyces beijiangensis TaxID=163361 RepID=A0A939F7H0_9ACTN|nr:DUF2293 domain-containing protein [Streptomyces beijiangensis]MBO0513008.1 DUF2293 domain-containing protein [Streptomyces beijiangensis]